MVKPGIIGQGLLSCDKGSSNQLAGSGRPGPARASLISWDWDRYDWVRQVSQGLVVKVTQDSFSKPFLWCHESEDRTWSFSLLLHMEGHTLADCDKAPPSRVEDE
jgi:hypothetical protein